MSAPATGRPRNTPKLSLRAHLLLGATLWTAGLFAAAGVFVTYVMFHHPSTPRIVHSPFLYFRTASAIALIFMILGFWQVRRGLSAVQQLHARLADVHEGRERMVAGRYPLEVQPLVNDLNALLEHREQAVKRAIAKAGDLAHGLKTPLAVLTQEAERVNDSGQIELAAAISQQVERMRRQIEYHLAHARASASGAAPGARCSIDESAQGLARTLRRLHAGRGVTIDVTAAADLYARCQREDLDEMLGNLLDNACKWGKSRVMLTVSANGSNVVMIVDDDGPGLETSKHGVVLQRGVRADEAAPGSGLGLAIVRELSELYGGSISLSDSPDGGLRARLQLPLAR